MLWIRKRISWQSSVYISPTTRSWPAKTADVNYILYQPRWTKSHSKVVDKHGVKLLVNAPTISNSHVKEYDKQNEFIVRWWPFIKHFTYLHNVDKIIWRRSQFLHLLTGNAFSDKEQQNTHKQKLNWTEKFITKLWSARKHRCFFAQGYECQSAL